MSGHGKIRPAAAVWRARRRWRRHRLLLVAVAALGLAACNSWQLEENSLQQARTLEDLRYSLILTNVAQGIDNEAPVPSQIVIATGTATNSTTASVSMQLPAMNFSKNTRALVPMGQVNWQNNWSFSPISDPQDIQNLRALYGLLYHSEDEIAHLIRWTEKQYELGNDSRYEFAPGDCGISWTTDKDHPFIAEHGKAIAAYFRALDAYPYLPQNGETAAQSRDDLIKSNCYVFDQKTGQPRDPSVARLPPVAGPPPPQKNPKQPQVPPSATPELQAAPPPSAQPQKVATFVSTSASVALSAAATLNVYYGLVYPTADQVRYALRSGDSLECRDYQTHQLDNLNKPYMAALKTTKPQSQPIFARWLFWRDEHGGWKPYDPPPDAPIESLGTYGGREFWTTARACLNDFIVLATASTANSHAAAQAKSANSVTGP